MRTIELAKRTLIVLAVALLPLLVWELFDVVLIVIGAILISILLRLVAEPVARWFKLPESIALAISGIVIIATATGVSYLFGNRIGSELQTLLSRLDTATNAIMSEMQGSPFGRMVVQHIQSGGLSIADLLGGLFSRGATFLEAAVVTVIVGFYFAAQPALYRFGLSSIFPRKWRANANETIDDIATALRLWLVGQLIEMLLVGLLSTLAVWLIGLPSPLALGVIAAAAEFIPYIGPFIAAVPALLVATANGLDAVLWTIAAYLLIHQIEGNVIAPMIQRYLVFIPPAVMLLSIVAIAVLFGSVAMIFAAPLTVILFVGTKKLYVRDSLGEETAIPGEKS
jgi:predicted PurR-regulated permease PerM